MSFRKLNYRVWVLTLPLLLYANTSIAADISPEAIKATYILQIQKFVTIGNPSRDTKKICYYEKQNTSLNSSVGQQIEKYVSTHPDTRLPIVKKFESIRDFSGCDIFYIPAEEESDIDNILIALGNSQTLTISGAQRFILRGGMIGFVVDEDNRVKMEANLRNAKDKNIHIDAQLLEIMQRVINQ